MKKALLSTLLILTMGLLNGCAWGLLQDERTVDTQTSDSALCTVIKNDLMALDMSQGWDLSVYSFYGHVFIIGEAGENIRQQAADIARRDRRVRSVTLHWFDPAPAAEKNLTISTRLRTALINAKGLGSSRVETVVNSNRVVLVGVMTDATERDIAVHTAANVKGVNEVTSYLMLPQRIGNPAGAPTPVTVQGSYPETPSPNPPTYEDRLPSAYEPPAVNL